MPGLCDSLRDRFRPLWRRPASPRSDTSTSRPTSSNSLRRTPTPPEHDPRTAQPNPIIPDPPAVPPVSAGIEDIRRQIWNEAYDKVKDDEPDVVDVYKKILSAQLAAEDAVPSADRITTNAITENAEARQALMKTLVEKGLDKTEKEAKIKEGFKERIQPVKNVKDFVSIAVKSEPSAAVAWLGITTLIDLIANPLAEPGINRDGIKYILERVEWYWELTQLLLDPATVDDSIIGLHSLLKRHVIKLYKKLLLFQMQTVCLYNKHWAAVIVRDLFKADDWQDKIDSIKKVEASLREDVNQHNSEELKHKLRTIDNTLSHLRFDVKAVESAVLDQTQVLRRIYHDKDDQKCLRDLCIVNPKDHKEDIERTKGGLVRDSYCWILEHDDFRRFRNDPESRLLWIKGDPGKGKTMLLCGIIDQLKQEKSQVLSYYFCQATQSELRSAVSVLRGLLWLLCAEQSQLTSFVRSKYDLQGKKLFEDNRALRSLEGIFLDMLKDPCLQDAVFVVDALDECSDDNREDLIDLVLKASRLFPSKWIVSSRNWPSIEIQFQGFENIRVPLELNKDSISQAVRKFVEYKVEQLARRKKYDPKTKDEVSRNLLLKANDTFLWVALVCKELARPQVKVQDIISKLDSVPEGLDKFYQRMLEQVLASHDRYRQILATACITYRPVSLDELRVLVTEVKNFSDVQLEEVIAECGSFLTTQDSVIYFVHQSAQDFLTDRAESHIFPSGIQEQHRFVSRRSLDALMTLTRDIYSLDFPGALTTEILCPKPDPLAHLRYSCLHWVDHLEVVKGDRNQSDDEAISEFISKRFLYWLEALSLQGKMSQGVKAVQKLRGIIANTAVSGLESLVEDARRFILSNKSRIEIAPLQVYASALIFSPEHSLIRRLFKNEEPDWILSKPRMEADWNACLQTLEGHHGLVNSVAMSADGQRIASGSGDKTVKIWDAATGALLQTLKGHNDSVKSVAISADGQRVASGSHDKTVKIWDAATGALLQTLEGYSILVMSVAISADGQRVASGSHDKIVKIWDAATGTLLQTLEGHSISVQSVALSADGQRVVSGSGDATVKIWSTVTGTLLQTLEGHHGWVHSVAISADGQRIASGSGDATVKIWDTATGTLLQTLEGYSSSVDSVAISADGQRVVSSSGNATVKIWDAVTGILLQTLEGHHCHWNHPVAISADGQRVASDSSNETVKIWDTAKIWGTAMDALLQTFQGHSSWVRSLAISADGQRVASGSHDKTVKIWDAATGTLLQTLEGHSSWVNSVAISADGQRIASGSEDETVKIWDAATGTLLQTLKGHSISVQSVAISADGQRVASGSHDKTVKIWDAVTGTLLQTLEGHYHWVKSVAISADGRRIASGSHDKTVKIWSAVTGALLQTLNTETTSYRLSFDLANNTRIATNIGLLNLNPVNPLLAIQSQLTKAVTRNASHSGYGISDDKFWLVKDEKNMLWLPQEYRPVESVVMGSAVAISCSSGRVLTIKFS